MLAAFTTLAFLATLWLVAVIIADTLGESWSKIVAALAGRSFTSFQPALVALRVTRRASARQQHPLRAEPRLRAAA